MRGRLLTLFAASFWDSVLLRLAPEGRAVCTDAPLRDCGRQMRLPGAVVVALGRA